MATSLAQMTDRAALTDACVAAADTVLARATDAVRAAVAPDGVLDPERMEREQHAVHGLAWLATYVQALRQMRDWAIRLEGLGRLGERERLILHAAFGEYLARIAGGIPMSQGEITRLHQLHLAPAAIGAVVGDAAVSRMVVDGTAAPLRARLAALIGDGEFGDWGLADDTLEMVREQFRRFAAEQIAPHAHGWHTE
ncbi:MAG: acyl-CoA dehydrogenase family protein, partial [Geminicoccaceae bacterium]